MNVYKGTVYISIKVWYTVGNTVAPQECVGWRRMATTNNLSG